jgi:hypothetical protein
MKKRIIALALVLALGLSLAGCGRGGDSTDLSCDAMVRAMLDAAPEGEQSEQLEWYEGQELDGYLADYYGLELSPSDGAVVRLGGVHAFELAVLKVPEGDANSAATQLRAYLQGRLGDFTGYEPEQAALVEGALVLTRGEWVALIVSQDPDAVRAAFDGCFTGNGSGSGNSSVAADVPVVLQGRGKTLPNGRVEYVDPEIDDMTLYDTAEILAAWHSGDPSVLSDYDRTIYDKAGQVLEEVLTDGMSDYDREKAVYQWIVTHVSYDYDHYDPNVTLSPDSSTPYNPLVEGKGICLGFSVTFQLLMDMAQVECITVVGASYQSQEDHAWNMVRLDGQWYCVDSTWDTGIESPEEWRYFNVTSDRMAETNHQWDYDAVPEATAKDGGRTEDADSHDSARTVSE